MADSRVRRVRAGAAYHHRLLQANVGNGATEADPRYATAQLPKLKFNSAGMQRIAAVFGCCGHDWPGYPTSSDRTSPRKQEIALGKN
jgi:hypothetical protein